MLLQIYFQVSQLARATVVTSRLARRESRRGQGKAVRRWNLCKGNKFNNCVRVNHKKFDSFQAVCPRHRACDALLRWLSYFSGWSWLSWRVRRRVMWRRWRSSSKIISSPLSRLNPELSPIKWYSSIQFCPSVTANLLIRSLFLSKLDARL